MKQSSQLCRTILIAAMVLTPVLALAQNRSQRSGDAMADPNMNQPSSYENQATDMTGGREGIVGKYDVVPVLRGKLVDEKGGPLDQTVKNKKGETLGTVERLLKDTKTGKIQYAVLELEETKDQLPVQWSQFKQEKGHLTLNASKKDLYPIASSVYSKDMSPEVSQYMDEINKVREQPKPKGGDPNAGGTDRPGITVGPKGADIVEGGSGPNLPRALPPGGAPGYEGGHPSSKR